MGASVEAVKLLVGDIGDDPLFDDDQYQVFIDLANDNPYRAAARALYAVAANAALTLKCLTILDVSVDGRETAEGIILAAKALDDLADEEEANTIVCGTAPVGLPKLTTHLRPWWEAL